MTQATDNIVLEHLRALRGDLGDVKNDMRDVKARLASIESYIATLHGDQTRTNVKLDDVLRRVERLEKRTGLVDA